MRRDWSKKDIELLNKHYPIEGCNKTAKILNRSYWSVNKKASRLQLKTDFKIKFAEKEEIIEAIDNSASISEALRYLDKVVSGVSMGLFRKYCGEYNIEIVFTKTIIHNNKQKSIEEWLVNGSTISSCKLKEKLYNSGLKNRICEKCGGDEWWHGEKISLILDHINGINNDNRLKNLRIVCPNCNATLPTHCRGYKKHITLRGK